MTHDAEKLYKNYWVGVAQGRDKRDYYNRLYGAVKSRISIVPGWRVLDVAGGDGEFLRYLEVPEADIIDISVSGLEQARRWGYRTIQADIEKRFPMEPEQYDAALCFEVLEHLYRPNKTLVEIHHVLKSGGVLYLGQPNMRADGVHHVRRYYRSALLNDLDKCGFRVEWIDYVPAYSMRDSILSDIRKNRSILRKVIQCVNLILSTLPWGFRYRMARWIPDRFALLFIVKAVKR